MRRLLRRRYRGSGPVIAASAVLWTIAAAPGVRGDSTTPALQIVSPVGRTGLPGTIRILAKAEGIDPSALRDVNFYVDKLFLAADVDGPPFEALWTDENPFERRELLVQAALPSGRVVERRIVLEPLKIAEAVDVRSVALEVSVLDERGRFVRDLAASDFAVFEDAEPQAIDLVAQRREPALFTLLIDSSQSMALRADSVRATAKKLLASLFKDDQIVVAPFSRGINTMTGPTTDHAVILDAISRIRPSGGTAILDTLQAAASGLAGQSGRRAIVLISDGYDEHSSSEFDAAVQALRKSDVTLYVVGVGGIAGISLKGEKLLTQLAESTGGRAWFPRDERRLANAYETIASDVQMKYFLTYTPTNQRQDGTWRAIDIRTTASGLRVRTREGYVAPEAPPIRTSMEFTAEGRGQEPATLTREDLEVLEDGVLQRVDTFQEAVLPVTIMLALDASGSMKKSASIAQEAAREFIGSLRPEDEVGMILFANRAEYVHSPTTRRDHSLEAIDKYAADGGTALYDALYDSLAQMDGVKGRRVVVVVTDGKDENAESNGPGSLRSWEDILQKLQKVDAAVYAVGVGSRVDRTRLQELARRSGGAAYFPTEATTLAADYHKIVDELRRRYVIGYESTNRKRDGAWRAVEIRAKHGITVRNRDGYFAPVQ